MAHLHKKRTNPKEFTGLKGPTSQRLSQQDCVMCLNCVIPAVLNYRAWRPGPYDFPPVCPRLPPTVLRIPMRQLRELGCATVTNNPKRSMAYRTKLFLSHATWQWQVGYSAKSSLWDWGWQNGHPWNVAWEGVPWRVSYWWLNSPAEMWWIPAKLISHWRFSHGPTLPQSS